MAYSIFTLEASNITISDSGSLDGVTGGNASQLSGKTITLDSNAWLEMFIDDDDPNFADNDGGQTLDGAQSYDGAGPFADGTKVEAEYTVEVTDGVNTYTLIGFNINEPGAANSYGTVEGLAFIGGVQGFPPVGVPLSVVSTSEGPGGSTTPASTYATPCFTPGTMIDTPHGAVAVEALMAGDLVMTRDAGPQALVWVGSVKLSAKALAARPSLAPIRIVKDALGKGRPNRDLTVSPQHRILLAGAQAELMFDAPEVLVPAVALLNDRTIRRVPTDQPVTYIHLLFAQHQIIMSDGLPTESFLPGPMTLPGMPRAAQAELYALFPQLKADLAGFGPPARTVLSAKQARALNP
jgi:hypothetical protein